MKLVEVWIDTSTGKIWHKDGETEITTEITELPTPPVVPTAAEVKTRMEEMGLRIR